MQLTLEAKRFTTTEALAKEVVHLLDDPNCKVIVVANEEALSQIAAELEGRVSEGRVEVVQLQATEPAKGD